MNLCNIIFNNFYSEFHFLKKLLKFCQLLSCVLITYWYRIKKVLKYLLNKKLEALNSSRAAVPKTRNSDSASVSLGSAI